MIQYLDNFPDSEYDPYALAIGKFALNWNFLQYALSELFAIVTLEKFPRVGDPVNPVPINIWHSMKSDRVQREILKVAIESSHLSKGNDLVESGKWLCGEVNKLETRRNDIMHSALVLMRYGTQTSKVIPMPYSHNPLSKRLSEVADLLEEFKSASHNAAALTDYALALHTALITTRAPWPRKPSLRGRPQTKKPAVQILVRHK